MRDGWPLRDLARSVTTRRPNGTKLLFPSFTRLFRRSRQTSKIDLSVARVSDPEMQRHPTSFQRRSLSGRFPQPEGMFRTTGREQLSQIQMTNYHAAITANIRLDAGVETRREFEIESELMGRRYSFTIAASEFARMDWPIEWMASSAITYPNQRDYARTATQSFSITAEERCIFSPTP